MLGPNFENITVVPQIGSKPKMWDVGCDRMVFAINSDLFLIKLNHNLVNGLWTRFKRP